MNFKLLLIFLLTVVLSESSLVIDPFQHLELITSLSTIASSSRHFGYDDSDFDGPDNWPGMCQFGSKQSPIVVDNSPPNKTVERTNPLRMIGGYELKPDSVHALNVGHGIVFTMFCPNLKSPKLTGGPLGNSIYKLHSFHFHYPCEHESIRVGDRCQLEVHFVHYNAKYENIGNATFYPDGFAVVGVMHEVVKDEETDRKLPFVPMTQKVRRLGMEYDETENLFSYKDALGFEEFPKLLAYKGSLTTPPCSK